MSKYCLEPLCVQNIQSKPVSLVLLKLIATSVKHVFLTGPLTHEGRPEARPQQKVSRALTSCRREDIWGTDPSSLFFRRRQHSIKVTNETRKMPRSGVRSHTTPQGSSRGILQAVNHNTPEQSALINQTVILYKNICTKWENGTRGFSQKQLLHNVFLIPEVTWVGYSINWISINCHLMHVMIS